MAETGQENDDRTEEATPERREDFRKKGQVAVSREITSVFVLASSIVLFSFYMMYLLTELQDYMKESFFELRNHRITPYEFQSHMEYHWYHFLFMIAPFFIVGSFCRGVCHFLSNKAQLLMAETQTGF